MTYSCEFLKISLPNDHDNLAKKKKGYYILSFDENVLNLLPPPNTNKI